MKTPSALAIMIFLFSFCLTTPLAQAQETSTGRTEPAPAITNVTVLFTMLPEECFMAPAPTIEERQALLAGATINHMTIGIKDVRNHYLNLTGTSEDLWEMCFWNTMDQGKLLGVNSRQCQPVCSTNLFFYRLDADGNLQPDTKLRSELEDQLTAADFYYTERMGERELSTLRDPASYIVFDLPRLGRDIVVRRDPHVIFDDNVPEHLLRPITNIVFVWDGLKFTKKSP